MKAKPFSRFLTVVLYSALLVACVGAQNVKQDYRLETSSEKGLVIGTLTLKQSAWVAPIFHFRSSSANAEFKGNEADTSSAIKFSENMITHRPRSDLPDRMAKMFAIELPPGKYNFYQLQFPKGTVVGTVYVDMSSRSAHNVSFEVEPGKVVYAGDLLIDADKSIMKGGVVKTIEARDLFDQDRPHLAKDYPNIDFANVKKLLFKVGG